MSNLCVYSLFSFNKCFEINGQKICSKETRICSDYSTVFEYFFIFHQPVDMGIGQQLNHFISTRIQFNSKLIHLPNVYEHTQNSYLAIFQVVRKKTYVRTGVPSTMRRIFTIGFQMHVWLGIPHKNGPPKDLIIVSNQLAQII